MMLRSNKTEHPAVEETLAPQPPMREPAASPVDTAHKEQTVIGEQIAVEGTIRAREDLEIQGTMKGSIEMQQNKLTVGPRGTVEADVNAQDVTVSGSMTGNIECSGRAEITGEANFTGQIKAKRVCIEDGAFVKATIEMLRDGETKKPPMPSKPAEKPNQQQSPRDSKRENQTPAGQTNAAK